MRQTIFFKMKGNGWRVGRPCLTRRDGATRAAFRSTFFESIAKDRQQKTMEAGDGGEGGEGLPPRKSLHLGKSGSEGGDRPRSSNII